MGTEASEGSDNQRQLQLSILRIGIMVAGYTEVWGKWELGILLVGDSES